MMALVTQLKVPFGGQTTWSSDAAPENQLLVPSTVTPTTPSVYLKIIWGRWIRFYGDGQIEILCSNPGGTYAKAPEGTTITLKQS